MKNLALLFFLALLCSQCSSSNKFWQQGTVTKADIEQPLEFDYQKNLLYIGLIINGQPRRFIIDSGAPMVVDKKLQEELQLRKIKVDEVTDSQNKRSKLEYVRIDELAFGGVEAVDVPAIVTDLSLFHCMGIDGLLGANVMMHFDWEIDYEKQEIQLYPRGSQNPAEDYDIAIPFTTKSQGTPDLKLRIPGLLTARGVTLDLGSTGGISIHKVDELKIPRDSSATFSYGITSKGIFGANVDTAFFLLADSLSIEGQLFQKQLVRLFNTSNKIGNAFWDQYLLFISWSEKRLYLKPREVGPPTLPEKLLTIGYDEGAVRVLTVYEKFGRLNNGIQFYDEVIALNGTRLEGMLLEDYCNLKTEPWEEFELEVRSMQSGQLVKIRLNEQELGW